MAQGRVDESGRQAGARDEGMAGLSAGRQRLAQELRGEPCRGFVRFGVKGGEQDRAPQALVERAGAIHGLAEARGRAGAQDAEGGEVFAHSRARHAAARVEDPPGDAALAQAKGPALARGEIGERESGLARLPRQSVAGADAGEVIERRPIAGQEEVVAVVDDEVERRVVIGPAAPAGGARRLVHDDGSPLVRQPDRGAEARQPRADHMDGAGHQISP